MARQKPKAAKDRRQEILAAAAQVITHRGLATGCVWASAKASCGSSRRCSSK